MDDLPVLAGLPARWTEVQTAITDFSDVVRQAQKPDLFDGPMRDDFIRRLAQALNDLLSRGAVRRWVTGQIRSGCADKKFHAHKRTAKNRSSIG